MIDTLTLQRSERRKIQGELTKLTLQPFTETPTEVWRPSGIEYYEVSDLGRVRSLARTKLIYTERAGYFVVKIRQRILKPTISGNFMIVNVGRQHKQLHMLVAKLFLDNPDNLKYVIHLNGNRTDNRKDNLKWTNKKGKPKPVCQYAGTELVNTFNSIRDAKLAGFNGGSIVRVCQGKRLTHRGFNWKYLN